MEPDRAARGSGAGSSAGDAVARLLRARGGAGTVSLPVTGSSMGRTIRDGSVVVVRAGPPDPRRWEVWAYCRPDGRVVVHRVVGRSDAGWWFRGDAMAGCDPVVPSSALVGRVVGGGPLLGRWRGLVGVGAGRVRSLLDRRRESRGATGSEC